jgi:hypothetical protein
MKKLTTTFLISLMLLTFNNSAFGGFFGDLSKFFFGDDVVKKPSLFYEGISTNVRCKVEYTQLDLATGIEKTVKHTNQSVLVGMTEYSLLEFLIQDLTDKINIWLNESKKHIISNMTIINCKDRILYANKTKFWDSKELWGEYKGCPDEFNAKIIDLLDRPKQLGYNVHNDRLIRDYEDGCKDYTFEGRF